MKVCEALEGLTEDNWTHGTLHAKVEGVDRYCALGWLAHCAGIPDEKIHYDTPNFFGKIAEAFEDVEVGGTWRTYLAIAGIDVDKITSINDYNGLEAVKELVCQQG